MKSKFKIIMTILAVLVNISTTQADENSLVEIYSFTKKRKIICSDTPVSNRIQRLVSEPQIGPWVFFPDNNGINIGFTTSTGKENELKKILIPHGVSNCILVYLD